MTAMLDAVTAAVGRWSGNAGINMNFYYRLVQW
jgi:hypothetical protein